MLGNDPGDVSAISKTNTKTQTQRQRQNILFSKGKSSCIGLLALRSITSVLTIRHMISPYTKTKTKTKTKTEKKTETETKTVKHCGMFRSHSKD